MSAVTNALPLPEIYYQHVSKNYWIKDGREKWIQMNEEAIKRFLKSQGYSKTVHDGHDLSRLDQTLMDIQLQQNVDYSGGLAGYPAGYDEINESRVLVTESPRLIIPAQGEWPLLNTILDGMFNEVGNDQRPYLYGWLKKALETAYGCRWSPGQALAFAGPPESAKSLLQRIITVMLGGRSSNPYQYMTGKTNFNADLFRTEHLMIEDQAESTDMRARRNFGSRIKEIAANQDQHCHGKNKEALTLTPRWRLTISLNDEPERMLVLPPIDDDIGDKIILLKVAKRTMPMPTASPEEKNAFWEAIMAELPAFVHFLQHWEIPENLRNARYGIRYYHHPELLEALNETAPESRLLNLVDAEIFTGGWNWNNSWTGTAIQLEQRLTSRTSESGVTHQARSLLSYANSCGTYLGRLERKPNSRVSRTNSGGTTIWTIQPPVLVGAEGQVCESNGENSSNNCRIGRDKLENLGHCPTKTWVGVAQSQSSSIPAVPVVVTDDRKVGGSS